MPRFQHARHLPFTNALNSSDEDHLALEVARNAGVALCTIAGIDGSFSRRIGAQLAITPDGRVVGDLADGCLEQQLKADASVTDAAVVRRYGKGSGAIDFRLPCGGGLDILIDPAPDRDACAAAVEALSQRREASIALPPNGHLGSRKYIPRLLIRIFGEGPEVQTLRVIAEASGVACEVVPKASLSLGGASGLPPADRWTAVVLLFHDHEWEASLLEEALASDAFYVGAQGGLNARSTRLAQLKQRGLDTEVLARLRSPIGIPSGSRSPQALALSVLAEIVGEYERLRPHA